MTAAAWRGFAVNPRRLPGKVDSGPASPVCIMRRMTQTARDVLNEVFGYPEFRGHQEQVIAAAMEGRDSLVLQPTGGGKSLCYQIPALLNEGVTIVVSPLIALMHDQVIALEQLGIAAACLNSSLTHEEQRAVLERLREGRLQLLYVAPERLIQQRTLEQLRSCNVVANCYRRGALRIAMGP